MHPDARDELPGGSAELLTVGYEGLDQERFVARLVRERVSLVVDVRLNALSRRPGFSKRSLAEGLLRAGIAYRHERALGNPPANRARFHGGDLELGRACTRAALERSGGEAIARLVESARHERVALMCVERFDVDCHRQVVVELVREAAPGLRIGAIW